MNELQKRIKRDIELILADKNFQEFSKKMKEWGINHQEDYKETLKSLKHIFKSKGFVLPKSYEELFWDWVSSFPPDSKVRKIMASRIGDQKILDLEPIPREYFIKWAKEYTSRMDEILSDPERPLNNHNQKTRIDYEPKYRFYLLEKLGVIDPKGIFYNTKLSLNNRAELLSKVLGYNSRDCKDLLNGQMKYDEEKKERIDDYLSDLMKNSTH